MVKREPLTGRCETSLGVDQTGPGLLVLKCHQDGVLHRMGLFGIMLCPEHCTSVANSERYVTAWEAGHCDQ